MEEPRWKLNELAGGCAAGLIQDGLLHPVDTMRARLDMGQRLTCSAAGATGTAVATEGPAAALARETRSVVAADGWKGLYRGYRWCLMTSAPCNAAYFGVYSTARRSFGGGSSPLHDAAAGLVAETIASVLWTPVDVVKQRLQVGSTGQTIAGTIGAAYNAAGSASGLWRGYFAGLMVWGPFSSVYFMTYEMLLRQVAATHDAKLSDNLVCGVSAGSVAALTTQPLDCAKTRIQASAQVPSIRLCTVNTCHRPCLESHFCKLPSALRHAGGRCTAASAAATNCDGDLEGRGHSGSLAWGCCACPVACTRLWDHDHRF